MAEQNHTRGRHRKFCEEFKRDAVELVGSTDRSIAQAAKELGISETTLGNWCRQAERDEGEREGVISDERGRLGQFERRARRAAPGA
jgi:transposase-like protein